jgi:hypothetical protein
MTVDDLIHIDASPDIVWAVTEDIERWPEWSPTMTWVKRTTPGTFGVGSVARIKQPMQPEAEWVVTEYVRGRRFAWHTRRTGIHFTGIHEVAPHGNGTQSRLCVEADGPAAVLFWPVLRAAMRRALSQENQGLKKRCDAR